MNQQEPPESDSNSASCSAPPLDSNLNKNFTGILPGPAAISAAAVAILTFIIIIIIKFLLINLTNYSLNSWQPPLIFLTIATLLSSPFRLPKWWPYIFSTLSILFILQQGYQIPIWIFPLGFIVLLLLNWNSFGDRVPLYLSNQKTIDGLSLMLDNAKDGLFYDLGCGTGSALIPLAKIYPDRQFVGVETSPIPWLIAYLRAKNLKSSNIHILRKSIWKTDISDASIIYAFLSPQPMNKLYKKCKIELHSKSMLISNSFDCDIFPAPEMIEILDQRRTKLLIWTF